VHISDLALFHLISPTIRCWHSPFFATLSAGCHSWDHRSGSSCCTCSNCNLFSLCIIYLCHWHLIFATPYVFLIGNPSSSAVCSSILLCTCTPGIHGLSCWLSSPSIQYHCGGFYFPSISIAACNVVFSGVGAHLVYVVTKRDLFCHPPQDNVQVNAGGHVARP